MCSAHRAQKAIVAGAAGETGYTVRFLSAATPADAPVVKSAIDTALGDGLQLACPVVGGSPLGYEFASASVRVRVPLSAGTGKVAKVLASDDEDGARWTEVPAYRVSQPEDGASVAIEVASLSHLAVLVAPTPTAAGATPSKLEAMLAKLGAENGVACLAHDDVAPALDASTGGVQTDPIGGAGDERDAERGHRHRRATMSAARMNRRVSLER